MLTYRTSLTPFIAVQGRCWCWILEPEVSPLEMIFSEIEKALEAGLPYLAIVATLSIPDICARLELDPDPDVEPRSDTTLIGVRPISCKAAATTCISPEATFIVSGAACCTKQ